jgi:hypothetical protein
VRFVGKNFKEKGVPIYDLAESLLAVQRIVNKAYLLEENRLLKGKRLTNEEREFLSLQITDRQRKSDSYGLSAFLSDPFVSDILIPLLMEIFMAFGAYAAGKVIESMKNNKNKISGTTDIDSNQNLAGFIYPQTDRLLTRVDGISGIKAIEFSSDFIDVTPKVFNVETKYYVKNLKSKEFYGDLMELYGKIRELNMAGNTATLEMPDNDTVKIYLDDKQLDVLRYQTQSEEVVVVTGHPIYKYGVETTEFSEFQVTSVSV